MDLLNLIVGLVCKNRSPMLLANIGIAFGIISLAITSYILMGSMAQSNPANWIETGLFGISWLSMFFACVGIFLNIYAMRSTKSFRPVLGLILTSIAFVCVVIFTPMFMS
jgi:hypothetical protein